MADPDDDSADEANPLRDISGALGGWARRVRDAVSDLSESFSLPESMRAALAEAEELRRAERFDGAIETLRNALADLPSPAPVPAAWSAWAIVRAHQRLVEPSVPEDVALTAGLAALDERPAGGHLVDAATRVGDSAADPAAAKDALRRARGRLEHEPPSSVAAIETLSAVTLALAEGRAGAPERQRRSLEVARALLDEHGGARLLARVRRIAVDAWLAAGRPDRARRWTLVGPAGGSSGSDSLDRGLIARVDAVSGSAGQVWQDVARSEEVPAEDRVRIGLLAGEDVRALAQSLGPRRQRLHALSVLAQDDASPSAIDAAFEALECATDASEGALRRQLARELGYCALRAGAFDRAHLRALAAEFQGESPELWLWARRAELATGGTPDPDAWVGDRSLRLRAIADVRGPHGPDEVSPLRSAAARARTLAAHRHLAAASRLAADEPTRARAEVLEALVADPGVHGAGELLTRLAVGSEGDTLEELLTSATAVLAEVPPVIAQAPEVSLAAAPRALRSVVAARERLARPLTIAVMGEFSSGKSTFVNALLGQELAPMGVLPTTNTINVFRRGANARARVHYRDGRVATVEAADVRGFLGGLDDTESAAIRYVEIERGGGGLGDATVVDTPGLNALDPYHERVARDFVDEADAVIWMFSATRGAVASERAVLDELQADGRRVLGILNKADTLEPEEVEELLSYLRDNVGDVLVDVLPLSASAALEAGPGADPALGRVLTSLDTAFLSRARELKGAITRRRLSDALDAAIEGLTAAASELDEDAVDMSADPTAAMAALGDAVHDALLAGAPAITRELLGVGVVVIGKGASSAASGAHDVDHVGLTVQDVLFDALRDALDGAAARESFDPDLVPVFEAAIGPWARGYVSAWSATGPARLLERAREGARDGERGITRVIANELRPLADDWRRHVWGLRREVALGIDRVASDRNARARAAGVSLRRATLPALNGLRSRLADGDAEGPDD